MEIKSIPPALLEEKKIGIAIARERVALFSHIYNDRFLLVPGKAVLKLT